jgi:integrase
MNINPSRDKQGIRLQFTVDGVRFSFAPLKGGCWENKRDRQLVAAIATRIENDILSGHFDSSLDKYRHKSGAQISLARSGSDNADNKKLHIKWLELWDKWVLSLELSKPTAADHYACVRAMILKAGNPAICEIEWLVNFELAASTFNRRLSMLRSCLRWAEGEELASENPLKKLKSRSASTEERQQADRKKAPLSDLEINRILDRIDRQYPSYGAFVRFMLFSGVRTGEAVGLTWENVDLNKRVIYVKETITRERGKYKKIRKCPKTRDSIRTLKMSERIYDLLVSILPDKPFGLIFASPKGRIIDHGNFRSKCWKPTLLALEIPYRKPYATRHTLLSEALESGLSVPQVAQIAGHSDGRMIILHYGHVINQPQLPE